MKLDAEEGFIYPVAELVAATRQETSKHPQMWGRRRRLLADVNKVKKICFVNVMRNGDFVRNKNVFNFTG